MKLTPAKDKVIIEQEIEKKVGSIIIPTTAQKGSTIGTVLAISASEEWLKEGDSVIFQAFMGQDVKLDGKDCKILDVTEILAKVEKEDA